MFANIKKFLKDHERALLPAFLFFGFIIDSFTLTRVDGIFDNILLLTYLILAGLSIILLYSHGGNSLIKKIRIFSPFLIQYAFGAIFSGLLIFYSRSSDFVTSLPFLLILIVLFLGNDILHRKYNRLVFQASIFYIATFSYMNLITPIIVKRINIWTFFLGSLLSVLIIWGFIKILQKVEVSKKVIENIGKSVSAILSLFLILYFANIIPPIPLSLKDGFIANHIERNFSDEYIISTEEKPWYLFFKKHTNTVHIEDGSSAYFFSSVFAPTDLKSTIYHEWSFYNTNTSRWESTDRIRIDIVGGRYNGFRGFSQKSNLQKGLWRVDVETTSRQVIGRVRFKINEPKEGIEIIEQVY